MDWITAKHSTHQTIKSLPNRQNTYGYVLECHICTVDPIETAAEFHEDALGDRPRYALAYQRVFWRDWSVWILYWLTFGSCWLILHWFPLLKFTLIHKSCEFAQATHVVIRTESGIEFIAPVQVIRACREVASQLDNWPPICIKCFTPIQLTHFSSEISSDIQRTASHENGIVMVNEKDEDACNDTFKTRGISSTPTFGSAATKLRRRKCQCQTYDDKTVSGSGGSRSLSKWLNQRKQLNAEVVSEGDFGTIILFEFKFVRYYLNLWDNCFEVVQFDTQLAPGALHEILGGGIEDAAVFDSRRKIFGQCSVDVPYAPLWKMWIDELTEPFYVFQLASIALWIWDDYAKYAYIVLAMTLISSYYDLKNARLSEERVRNLCRNEGYVNVFRELKPNQSLRKKGVDLYFDESLLKCRLRRIPYDELLPGDLFEVESGSRVPCDAVVLWGGAVVSETILTGESVPSLKVPLPQGAPEDDSATASTVSSQQLASSNVVTEENSSSRSGSVLSGEDVITSYKIDQDARCSLYAATTVLSLTIPAKGHRVLALAVRTGFLSRHGRSIRSLVFPNRPIFNLNKQAMQYIKMLFATTILGTFISIVTGLLFGFPNKIILIRTLDLFTDSIPPALPAVLSIGTVIAINRLRFQFNIDCINAGRINLAGQVATFVFDKTGTLTQQGLEFGGCLLVENLNFPKSAPTRGRQYAAHGLDLLFPSKPFLSVNYKLGSPAMTRTSSASSVRMRIGTIQPTRKKQVSPGVTPTKTKIGGLVQLGTHEPSKTQLNPYFGPRCFDSAHLTSQFLYALATCHNITMVNGTLMGDPLELQMLSFTGWTIHDITKEIQEVAELEKQQEEEAQKYLDLSNVKEDTSPGTSESAVEPILSLYDSGQVVPTIMKPPGIVLSVTQLLRRGYTVADLNSIKNQWQGSTRNSKTTDDSVSGKPCRRYSGKQKHKQPDTTLREHLANGRSEMGILKRFEFSSALQRMSVVARDPISQELFAFCKGSPEVISDLCLAKSLPEEFHLSIMQYTQRGARVIAVAGKPLGRLSGRAVNSVTRTDVESKLTLLGCLIFANRLKTDTKTAISSLAAARCRCVIATGDNPLTAMAVGKECGLIRNVEDSSKEVILGDLYIPRTHLAATRVGQRSYFVWTKLERKARPRVVANLDGMRSSGKKNLLAHQPMSSSQSYGVNSQLLPSFQDNEKLRVTLMKRMLEAHSRKLTTLDLRDFLRGQNPRNFVFILTGRAFRKLRMLHEELNLSWFGQSASKSMISERQPSSIEPQPLVEQLTVHPFQLQSPLSSPTEATNLIRPSSQSPIGGMQPNVVVYSPERIPNSNRHHLSPTTSLHTTPLQHLPSPDTREETSDFSFWKPFAEGGTPRQASFEYLKDESEGNGSTVSTISSRSKQCQDTDRIEQCLSALVGRYQLEPYEDVVAASIIFGAYQTRVPEQVPAHTQGGLVNTYFSERSSWISASTLSLQIPSRPLSRLEEHFHPSLPSTQRRKKPVRNLVGPPQQAIRAAQLGNISTRFPFSKRQTIIRSPKKTRKIPRKTPSTEHTSRLRFQSFNISDYVSSHLSGPFSRSSVLPISAATTVGNRDVFWLFDTGVDTGECKRISGRLQGLRVRCLLPPQDQKPPPTFLKQLAQPLRRLGIPVSIETSDESSDEEESAAMKKLEPNKISEETPFHLDRGIIGADRELEGTAVQISSSTNAKTATEGKNSQLFATWPWKQASPVSVISPFKMWNSIRKGKGLSDAMEPLLGSSVRTTSTRYKPQLPTPLEDTEEIFAASNQHEETPTEAVQLADVSYAESQALSQTATSLHFHPNFAFPTRSSYAGPPAATRLPGLSTVVAEKAHVRPGSFNYASEGTSLSSGTALPPAMFPATSRLAHKGLIPATNHELMLLTVVIAKRKGSPQYAGKEVTDSKGQSDMSETVSKALSPSNRTLLKDLFIDEGKSEWVSTQKQAIEQRESDSASTIICVTPRDHYPRRQSTDAALEDTADGAFDMPDVQNIKEDKTVNLTALTPREDQRFPNHGITIEPEEKPEIFSDMDRPTEYELVRLSLFEFLLRNTRVYARMSPEDKTSLVTSLKELPGAPAIGMCGDGPNDCGALRAADVGVSLNDATASIAAPFTAKTKSIQGCVDILREGRGSLVKAFQVFKFIIYYSVIQYTSVVLLYLYGLNYTDYQYMWVDFIIILPLSFAISETDVAQKLKGQPPSANLLSKHFLGGIIIQSIVAVGFMIFLLIGIRTTPGWRSFETTVVAGDSGGAEIVSYENTSLFYLTNFQYLTLCWISASSGPWSKGILTNIHFVLWMVFLIIVNIASIILPRPSTIMLPTYEIPSPNPLPRPNYNDVGWLTYTMVLLDQWLMLTAIPLSAKMLILLLAFSHWIFASMIDFMLIDRWREEERQELRNSLLTSGGPIPNTSKNVSVFHVL